MEAEAARPLSADCLLDAGVVAVAEPQLTGQIPWLRVFVEGVVIAPFLWSDTQSPPPIR